MSCRDGWSRAWVHWDDKDCLCWQGWAFVAKEAGTGAPIGRERVLLEKLLTPLAAVLQPAGYGASSRPLRLNTAACGDAFVMARAARAVAGAGRFLRGMRLEGRVDLSGGAASDALAAAARASCASVAQALPKMLVAAVSLLQARARRVHGPALALISDVVAWLDRAHRLLEAAAAQDEALGGQGVVEWKRALSECGVAAMVGVLHGTSEAGCRWSKEQVEALLQLLLLSASPLAAAAAQEHEGEGHQAAPADAAAGEDVARCDMRVVEGVVVQVLIAKLGDWWLPANLPSQASTPHSKGSGDLFGAGIKDPDDKEVEPDAWLGGLAMCLQSALTSTEAGSPRQGVAQRLLTALLPPIHHSVSTGPPAREVPAVAAAAGSVDERVCTQCVRLLLLGHNAAPEHAKAQVLGAVVASLLQLTPDPDSQGQGRDAQWPPASIGAVAVKTITALASVDTATFRLQVAAMPAPLQLRLRTALAASR